MFMDIKKIRYLIFQNWTLFSKTMFRIGKNDKFSFPRFYIIIPILFFLAYEAFVSDEVIRFWMLFLMSLIFFEMARIYNKCFFDPVHLFYSPNNFRIKLVHIILLELFGIKILSVLLFSIIGLLGSSKFMAISILFCLYGIFTLLFVFISVIGNRIKIVSVIYQWVLIIIFSLLYGFSGLSFSNSGIALQELHLSFQDRIEANFVGVLLFLLLILILLNFMGFKITKRIYCNNPFINPEAFPRKMI
jgi:hypothetical protein